MLPLTALLPTPFELLWERLAAARGADPEGHKLATVRTHYSKFKYSTFLQNFNVDLSLL